jgi:hypothetical protein
MKRLRAFGDFWWDFILGDDWRMAAGVAIGLALTALVSRLTVSSWWVLLAAVTASLVLSLRRVVSRR